MGRFFVYNKEIKSEKITKKIELMVISILQTEYLGDYKIRFYFSDDIHKKDFKDFIMYAKNPMTQKYQDEKLFKHFSTEYGDIQCYDFEMCFPIWDLYQGKIK